MNVFLVVILGLALPAVFGKQLLGDEVGDDVQGTSDESTAESDLEARHALGPLLLPSRRRHRCRGGRHASHSSLFLRIGSEPAPVTSPNPFYTPPPSLFSLPHPAQNPSYPHSPSVVPLPRPYYPPTPSVLPLPKPYYPPTPSVVPLPPYNPPTPSVLPLPPYNPPTPTVLPLTPYNPPTPSVLPLPPYYPPKPVPSVGPYSCGYAAECRQLCNQFCTLTLPQCIGGLCYCAPNYNNVVY